MCCSRSWLTIGAVMAGLSVTAGAFGAHGLDTYFEKKYADIDVKKIGGHEVPASFKYLEDFKTAARYQMYHAFGLMAVGLLALRQPKRSLNVAGWCFLLGIVLFSGSLYVLTIGGPHWQGIRWGLVAPFGGMLLIAGWVALAVAACGIGNRE